MYVCVRACVRNDLVVLVILSCSRTGRIKLRTVELFYTVDIFMVDFFSFFYKRGAVRSVFYSYTGVLNAFPTEKNTLLDFDIF